MTEEKSCSCMADIKHKHREEQEYKQLVCRLNRIEGQVRGIKKCWKRNDTVWTY